MPTAKAYDDVREFLSPRICQAIEDVGGNVNGYMTDQIDNLVRAIVEDDGFELSAAAIEEIAAFKRACPTCQGDGNIPSRPPHEGRPLPEPIACPTCHGEGNVLLDDFPLE